MKRILSLLTVFVMVFALSVPALAVGDMYAYTGKGTIIAPDYHSVASANSEYPYVTLYENDGEMYLMLSKVRLLAYYVDTDLSLTPDRTNGLNKSGIRFKISNGDWVRDGTSTSVNNGVASIYNWWTNYSVYVADSSLKATTELYATYSTPVLVPQYCDGSSCSAIDVNVDGICDDCGMQLYNLRRNPVVPDVSGNNKHYALFSGTWDGLEGWYYVVSTSSEDYTIRGDVVGDYYKVTYDAQAESSMYISHDGINWEREAMNYTSSRFVPKNTSTTLLDSSHNWYDEAGNLFFPLPLWETVERVTQGEMMGLMATTGGTMSTLVLCGVGCLSLLVVLKLFGKRSLIFRS